MLWDTFSTPWRVCLEEAWMAYRLRDEGAPVKEAVNALAGQLRENEDDYLADRRKSV